MLDVEKVIKGLECCVLRDPDDSRRCAECPKSEYGRTISNSCINGLMVAALALLKAQEQRHRLEVHNIGNVDIPENVTEKQFHAVMNNVVAALEHTDKGESWPYDEEGR